MNVSHRLIQIENPQASDGAVSMAEQLGYGWALAPARLLPEREGEAIDLSNAEPGPAPAVNGHSGPPRLVNWRRSKHPILPGWPSANGRQLVVPCPWCGWHYHGRHGSCPPGTCECRLHDDLRLPARVPCTCPPGAGDGWRSAHCAPRRGSPLAETGYVVREVRP